MDELEIVSRSDAAAVPGRRGERRGVDCACATGTSTSAASSMQRNLRLSATVVAAIRRYMDEHGFVDIWTPNLRRPRPRAPATSSCRCGSTRALLRAPPVAADLQADPDGRRDGPLLPDATCFRDEDLRADRQFEFRQLDLELSFPDARGCLATLEGAVGASFEALERTPPERPFQRLTWHEAMARYGSDKPDLRFGLELHDLTEATRDSEFKVFAQAPSVQYLAVPQELSRAELGSLEGLAKEWGGKGLAYLVFDEEGEVRSPIAKFLSAELIEAVRPEQPSATVLFGADEPLTVARVLSAVRNHLGRELGLIDTSRDEFLWVTDFPLFEWDEDGKRWTFSHHPFTGVRPGDEDLIESRPRARAEPGVRPRLERLGARLGLDQDPRPRAPAARLRRDGHQQRGGGGAFGFLLEVLRMGAPPHGGFAMGLERFVALLAGEQNIREVVAFPKTASGSEPLSGAPTPIAQEILAELGIQVLPETSLTAPGRAVILAVKRGRARRRTRAWRAKVQSERPKHRR